METLHAFKHKKFHPKINSRAAGRESHYDSSHSIHSTCNQWSHHHILLVMMNTGVGGFLTGWQAYARACGNQYAPILKPIIDHTNTAFTKQYASRLFVLTVVWSHRSELHSYSAEQAMQSTGHNVNRKRYRISVSGSSSVKWAQIQGEETEKEQTR